MLLDNFPLIFHHDFLEQVWKKKQNKTLQSSFCNLPRSLAVCSLKLHTPSHSHTSLCSSLFRHTSGSCHFFSVGPVASVHWWLSGHCMNILASAAADILLFWSHRGTVRCHPITTAGKIPTNSPSQGSPEFPVLLPTGRQLLLLG